MEIQLWREILNPYDLAVKELTVKFEHLIQEHRQQGLYSPIEQVHGRVKTISSILDKAQKKNIPINEIEDKLEDIAGIRIICQFVEDIQKVVEIIRSRTDMKVIEEKDYVKQYEKQRLPQLSYDCRIYRGDDEWSEAYPCGDPDPDSGHEFLGDHRTFSPV